MKDDKNMLIKNCNIITFGATSQGPQSTESQKFFEQDDIRLHNYDTRCNSLRPQDLAT